MSENIAFLPVSIAHTNESNIFRQYTFVDLYVFQLVSSFFNQ
jgi:hypothetical protein